MFVIVVLIAKS